MAENAGRIEYQFAAETDGVLKAGTVVDKTTDKMVKDFDRVDKSVKNFNTQTTKASQGVKRAFGSNLGQAGIQVQQFVGQLQGGQSAMVALAQQSADLGIVLGAPLVGVFVSLAAVLAGTLAPAIFGSVSNIEKLQKAIENTKAIMTLGKNGIIEYTDEMKRLETASENLAKIKIALAITENTNALKDSRKEFIALRADLFGFQEDSSEAAKRLTGMTDQTGNVLDLASALQAFSNSVTDESKLKALERAENVLLQMRNDKGEFPTKDLTAFAQEFFTLADATRQAITNNQALKKSNENLDTSTAATGESFNKLRIGLKEQTIALQDGERAAFKYSLLMSGEYSAAQIEAALKIYDTNAALKAQKEDAEESAATLKKVNNELDAFFDKESKQSTAKDDRERGQAERFAQGIISRSMSEPERFAAELERLEELRKKGLLSQQLYDQAIVASVENRGNELDKINATQEAMQNRQRELLLTSTSDVFGGIADILRNSQGEQSDAYKAMFALSKGFAIANAGLNLSLAISQALADPSALTIYQKFANYAAIASAGGALISSISGMNYSGGRQYGGAVSNGMYRVNETGIPEIRSYGGKDYLMETQNAQIKPLDKIGGEMNVVINNNAPGVDVSASQVNQRTVEISVRKSMQEFANQAASGQGEAINSLIRNTNVTRKGGV